MKRILEVKKKIGTLSKNSANPFFKSKYLDLNSLLVHIEPLLIEQGLLLTQPIIDGLVISRIIDTETGATLLESSLALPTIQDPQKLGSCITYYRRYTLKSLLSIAEDDDDANAASDKVPDYFKKSITPTQLKQAKERIDKGEVGVLDKLKKMFDLTVEEETQLTNKYGN
jgi:hypothetical protein